ncbi:carbohydrate binding family 9 domain-containing protein [Hymenobacter sp. RP-2-7]|uniref:Carbohydrate binding family 9 domain-containing protein n=1 Tax=Hymenobacter polaris TaxID=2682546 RepID=A0A7Y0ACK9_9BACT|nr:DUF5916 domain-containing protein [Hymenobacter polaris]NML64595.1 carbohydrate binding family 9 domain-containing protein [Hymenobacter polaris]
MFTVLLRCGLLSLWLASFCAHVSLGQSAPATAKADAKALAAPALPSKRQLAATRTATPIKLDGVLDDAAWATAPVASHFIEQRPKPGRPERLPTEARILYDDAAIYVGAVLHEASPDSIRRELTQRDGIGNTDFFGIFLDPYRDHLNGYGFIVLSTGVQFDARYSPANGEDDSWNAVWESRVALLPDGKGWSVEIRIPYSAIRFAATPVQTWGLNLMRQRKASNQQFFWNEVKPQVDGFVNQWGELTELRDLHPPLRLSLTPYVSAYVNHYPYNLEGKRNASASFNGGADLKWGINESFTLDATLVPDFGQTISDNQVLNLSPFEVQYQENRTFFTEGTELFNKGNLFYSRRVGAQPLGFGDVPGLLGPREFIVQNPGVARLYNATKVSGRTSKGLGVGVFNAVSASMYATVQDSASGQQREILTQPLTNYNIVVLDQSLPHNSYVSLINTNVTRAGRAYDANVTAGLFKFADKKNEYAVRGQANYSRRRGVGLNSETPIDDQNGYKYYVNAGKISGNWLWTVDHGIESDTYNPNDLGILFGNNNISQSATVNYNKYQPFWKVNNLYTSLGVYQSLLFRPLMYQDAGIYSQANTTFTKSFITAGFNANLDWAKHDYYEPRTYPLGTYYVQVPTSANLGAFVSSDYRKKLAYDANAGIRRYALDGRPEVAGRPRRYGFGLTLSPRYRVNDRLNFRYTFDYSLKVNQVGYVNDGFDLSQPIDQQYSALLGPDVLLGRRNVSTFTNTLTTNYTFTNRLSFTMRVRHYVSTVHYWAFARLHPGGQEETLPGYDRNHDTSFNAFNVDASLVWWFAPGSQVSLVWKNASATSLLGNEATPLYFDNLTNVANTPHNNNVSIKILYYLDYLALRPRRG